MVAAASFVRSRVTPTAEISRDEEKKSAMAAR
jgi:hypothetical protein